MSFKNLIWVYFAENAPETDKRDLLSELEIMKQLKSHPHVIKLLGCVTESGKFWDKALKETLFSVFNSLSTLFKTLSFLFVESITLKIKENHAGENPVYRCFGLIYIFT